MIYESLIVGAGPGGLSAALYMARFRRSTLVLHDGKARALRIPTTHNAPGFNEGVAGPDLIDRMRCHAEQYGATLCETHIASARHDGAVFTLTDDNGATYRGRTLILATGIRLNQIDMPQDVHEAAIRAAVLRYCPVCDGFEHIDKRIGVIGCDTGGAAEALFLRQYSADITVVPQRFHEMTADERGAMAAAGIKVVATPVDHYVATSDCMEVHLKGVPDPLVFDVVYPALGVAPRTRLAGELGLSLNDRAEVEAGAVFETQVPGLYCVGDIVDGLDQISVAMGHGAIAATKAHNWLREQDAHTLDALTEEVTVHEGNTGAGAA